MGATQYDKSSQASSALVETIGLSSQHGAQEWILDETYNAQKIDTNHPPQNFVLIFCIQKNIYISNEMVQFLEQHYIST
jgi:hypothetical protein